MKTRKDVFIEGDILASRHPENRTSLSASIG